MTKNRILLLFIAAGLILALVLGFYVYRTNRPPAVSDAEELLQAFINRITNGGTAGARELMTAETAHLLRDPVTDLGRTVYRNLTLVSVDNVFISGEKTLSAYVILSTVDTLTVMTKAGLLFAEQAAENGPAEDPDAVMAEIYKTILSREDLPMAEQFLIIRMSYADGNLRIIGDETLQRALEGSSAESLNAVGNLFSDDKNK